MDLGTMRHKVETHQYANIEAFEKDLQLIWNNAMIYNQKDTIYYRAAVRIKEAGLFSILRIFLTANTKI